MWIFNNITDITPTEICYMDIPTRLYSLVKFLYQAEATDDVNLLIDIYKEIHEQPRSNECSDKLFSVA